MSKFLSALVLGLVASFASAGVVDPIEKCTGLGFAGPVSITDCTTPPCVVVVGRQYDMDFEFLSVVDSPGLIYKLTAFFMEGSIVVVEAPLPGSQIIAGQTYSLEDSMTPSDRFVDRTFDLELELSDSKSRDKIICIKAPFTVVAE